MHCKTTLISLPLVSFLIPEKSIKLIFGRWYIKFLSNFKSILILIKNLIVFVIFAACGNGWIQCWHVLGHPQWQLLQQCLLWQWCSRCYLWRNSADGASCGNGIDVAPLGMMVFMATPCGDGVDVALNGNVVNGAPNGSMESVALWQWHKWLPCGVIASTAPPFLMT